MGFAWVMPQLDELANALVSVVDASIHKAFDMFTCVDA